MSTRKDDRIDSLVTGVPSGVVVGRTSPGTGKAEYIDLQTLGDQLAAAGAIPASGGTGGTVTSVAFTGPGGIFTVSGSPVTSSGTIVEKTTGSQGGIPYFANTSTLSSTPALTANAPVIGGGTSAPTVGSRSGNTTSFGTTSGTLTSGHVAAFDAAGNIIDGGTTPGGSGGTVTSVAFTGPGGIFSVSGSPVTTAGTITENVSGATGGIPYFPSSGVLSSTAALTANAPVIGGGASGPTVGSRSGNTTEFATVAGTVSSGHIAKWDAAGNVIDGGSATGATLEITDNTTDLTAVSKITFSGSAAPAVTGSNPNGVVTIYAMLPLTDGSTSPGQIVFDGLGQCIGVYV